jgi:hypothetical protein
LGLDRASVIVVVHDAQQPEVPSLDGQHSAAPNPTAATSSLWTGGWLEPKASEPLTQSLDPCPPAHHVRMEVHALFGRGALTVLQTKKEILREIQQSLRKGDGLTEGFHQLDHRNIVVSHLRLLSSASVNRGTAATHVNRPSEGSDAHYGGGLVWGKAPP